MGSDFSSRDDLPHVHAALRAAEARWEAFAASSEGWVSAIDANDRITYVNRGVPGVAVANVLGRSFYDFVPPEKREELVEVLAGVRRTGQVHRREFVTTVPDGREHCYESRFIPIISGGEVTGILHITADLTERRRYEEHLRHSQKMEATGLLAAGVAHDFNNLLGVVLTSTELAQRALGSHRSPAEHLEVIAQATRRAAELTRKLLAFSRQQVLRVDTVDLGGALTGIAKLIASVIGEDVELTIRHAPEPLFVRADALQLEQVLLNLCNNARQAMPAGGRLIIETRRAAFDAEALARSPWAKVGEFGEIRVSDSGIGMDEATRARIFEPFFSTRDEGTGLGLAMVYGILEQHGGCVHIESRPGEGTTVRAYLPLAPSVPVAAHREPDEIARGREVVLLAEDEAPLRRLLVQTLGELGYEVLAAPDGEAALRLFDEHRERVALVMLDVVMPRLGGLEAFERMRERSPALPAIFMTGYAPESARVAEIASRTGASILLKPFSLDELGRRARETLDARVARATMIDR